MTKTEQYQGAWSVLLSENELHKMIDECDCKPDELDSAIPRLERVKMVREQKAKKERLDNVTQQMMLAGISIEELALHIQRQPKKPKKQKASRIHAATVDDVEVYKGEKLPEVVTSKGWNRINQIPEEYKESLKK